jgi:hypothetical protein
MGQWTTSCASNKGKSPKGTLIFAGAKPKKMKEKRSVTVKMRFFMGLTLGRRDVSSADVFRGTVSRQDT